MRLPPRVRRRHRARRALSLRTGRRTASLADPASRSQPEGVHGDSAVVDPELRVDGRRVARVGRCADYVIYELHVGTFTDGRNLRRRDRTVSPSSRELGVTAIELMPVAEFPGRAQLGLRRRLPVRGAVELRRAGRTAPPRRRRSRPRTRGRARRRLQPPRARRERPPRRSGPTSPTGTARRGARRSTSTVPAATRFAATSSRTPLEWVDDFHIDALRLDAVHAIVDPERVPVRRRADRRGSRRSPGCRAAACT